MSGGEPILLYKVSGEGWGESSVIKDSGGDRAFIIKLESVVSENSKTPVLTASPTTEPGSRIFLLTSSNGPGRMSSRSFKSSWSFFRFKHNCLAIKEESALESRIMYKILRYTSF